MKPRRSHRKRCFALATLCSTLVTATRVPAAPVLAPAAAPGGGGDVFASLSDGVAVHGTLSGPAEIPATTSDATGTFAGMLTGSPGRYVLTFELGYANLSSDPVAAHVHYAVSPPGRAPREQEGPVVFDVPDAAHSTNPAHETYHESWRWDDRRYPLTDALADSLMDGELYLNIHSKNYPDGEIRGAIKPDRPGEPGEPEVPEKPGTPEPPQPPSHPVTPGTPEVPGPGGGGVHPVPLPAPVALGAVGLGLAGFVARRRMTAAV